MVKESKKISSQLMHEENIFFPCSFAVFILPPIGINFGILKRIVLTDHWCSENNFQLNRYFTGEKLLIEKILKCQRPIKNN